MSAAALPPNGRLLLVRLGALGDIVHALPVLAAVRAARPDVEVDWLVDARYAAVLALVGGLRARIVIRAASAGADEGEQRFAGPLGMAAAVRALRARAYDAAVDLQGLLKSAVLTRAAGARRALGFVRGQLREPQASWLYSAVVAGPAHAHVVAKNLAVLPALGLPVPEVPGFPWLLRASAVADAVRAGGEYAVLNPGAAWPNKRWPAARFGDLAARLRAAFGLRSVVTWGGAEQALAAEVVAASNGYATASPPTTLADLLALARGARLVVSGDTGPLHLAASVGAPLVGIFGPTRPERNGPWRPDDEVVSRAATCVCFHKRRCLRGRACVDDIPVEEVLAACERRLARVAAR
jgi:lipopolysaccharide heptosyltransferase I